MEKFDVIHMAVEKAVSKIRSGCEFDRTIKQVAKELNLNQQALAIKVNRIINSKEEK